MSKGYTKLFADIVTSTIWQEPNDCRVLWITILALKDEDNICRATVPALAKLSNITIDECEAYLHQFQQPDKYSRSQHKEGRRIESVEGGFFVINGQRYRDMLRAQERREYVRKKVAEHRAKAKTVKDVTKCKQGNQCKPISEEEEEVKENNNARARQDPTDFESRILKVLSFFNISASIATIGKDAEKAFMDQPQFLEDEAIEVIRRQAGPWREQDWITNVNPRFIAERLAEIYHYQPNKKSDIPRGAGFKTAAQIKQEMNGHG